MLFVPKTPRRAALRRHREAAVGGAAVGAGALGAVALGAVAVGALAFGALAIGALAISRLTVREAKFKRVRIGELEVGRLRLITSVPPESQSLGPKEEPISAVEARDERDVTAPERQDIERAEEAPPGRETEPDSGV